MGGSQLYNQQREYFLSFLARTNQKQRTVENLFDYLPVYSPQTAEAVKEGRKVRFLDLGPGIGGVFVPFVGSLGKNVDCVIQEPNLGMAVNFFFNYLMEDLPQQRLRVENKEVFDYDSESFDFVLSSHSFYYLPDWQNTLQKMYDSLVPGGAACIVLGSEESELIKLRKEFFPELYGVDPKTAEDLEAVLDSVGIPYESSVVHSRIDLALKIEDEIRHLKEEGILEPSLEALFSFMLRTDFTKLPPEMQERVGRFCSGDYLNLIDKAIWLKKPGMYEQRTDAGENIAQKVTLADFLQRFRPMLETHFGQDLAFLSPSLREAYSRLLAMDCVLSHPISKLAIMLYKSNSDTDYDDYFHPFKPKKGMKANDFVLFDPKEKKLKDLPSYLSKDYVFLYTHSGDMIPYFFDLMTIEYESLPAEDKAQINKREFSRLILHLFKRHKHSRIFSNRHDGSTLMGLFVESEYVELGCPEELTPQLGEYYEHLGISTPVLF
jgi:SAM-dependent methyltransferase